jgi:hypothetical protein
MRAVHVCPLPACVLAFAQGCLPTNLALLFRWYDADKSGAIELPELQVGRAARVQGSVRLGWEGGCVEGNALG